MSLQTPVKPGRIPAPSIPGSKMMPPLPDQPKGLKRWAFRTAMLSLLLVGLTYLLGRTVEPIRVRLAPLPAVGGLWFGDPVWQVLWNKGTPTGQNSNSTLGGAQLTPASPGLTTASTGDVSLLEAEAAARLAAAEVKENGLKRLEADLAARELALKGREQSVAEQEKRLGAEVQMAEGLRKLLEGQRRAELDRVEIVRNMKSSAIGQLFAAMTDEEVLRVLMYMEAEEVAQHLSVMDPYRSARLLQALREIVPSSSGN